MGIIHVAYAPGGAGRPDQKLILKDHALDARGVVSQMKHGVVHAGIAALCLLELLEVVG